MGKMDYDIVMATANRPEILLVSLPTMVRQTRPARRLIIADASDDPSAIERAVRQAANNTPRPRSSS